MTPTDPFSPTDPEERDPSNDPDRTHETKAFSSYSRLADASLFFEKTWTEARVLSIESCLDWVEEEDREELFALLLEIDITKGFMARAVIPVENYHARFPQWKELIDATFAQFNQQTITGYGRLGTKIGHYRIHEVLGKGAMGIVFKATDEILFRTVALKYILPQANRTQEAQKKMMDLFCNEVAMLGQLKRDTKFVQAYESNWDGDFLYLVMEYVDGDDLAKYVKQKGGKLPFHEAVRYIRQIAEGLCEIHDLGIIHRDIKPENVIRSRDGTIRILDLGLGVFKDTRAAARILEQANQSQHSLNNSALVLDTESQQVAAGTPAYWSPEAYHTPESIDARSDLFSLGGTFFFLLTGILPIKWRNPIEKGEKENRISLKSFLEKQNVSIPNEGLVILQKLLDLNPDLRFTSAQELLQALKVLEEKFTPKPWYLRWKRLLKVAVVAAVAGLSLFLFNIYTESQSALKKLQSAQQLKKSGKEAAALLLLVDQSPDSFSNSAKEEFLALRGSLYQTQGNQREYLLSAQKDFSALIEMKPENLDYQKQYIHLNLKLGEDKLARKAVIQMQKRYPRELAFQILDAEILLTEVETKDLSEENKRNHLREALDILTDVLGQDASLWQAFFWRAKTYHALNNIDFALMDLEEVLKLNRNVPSAWLLMADLYFAKKNYQEALKCWDYITQRNPNLTSLEWADLFLKKAQSLFYLKQYDECMEACNRSEKEAAVASSQLLQLRAESAFFVSRWEIVVSDFRNLFRKNIHHLFSSNEQLAYYTMFVVALFQLGENAENADIQKEYLNECISVIDSCRKRFPNQRYFSFFGKKWSLREIYLHANMLLGNNEVLREHSESLFHEIQETEAPISNATLE